MDCFICDCMFTHAYRANWVKVDGIKYQEPCALVIGQEEDNLKFGKITQIYVDGGKEVIFEIELLHTIEFCTHYHTYSLSSERQTSFIKQCHLLDYHPYGLYQSSFVPFISFFNVCCNA